MSYRPKCKARYEDREEIVQPDMMIKYRNM